MKTNCLVKMEVITITQNGESVQMENYTVDNVNGWMPAVEYTDGAGKVLIVITKALEFDLLNKRIIWKVKEFSWNTISGRWVRLWGTNKTGKFREINPDSTITVDNDTYVNYTNGTYCEANDPYAIGEFNYYIEALGKPMIYPSLQYGIGHKLDM